MSLDFHSVYRLLLQQHGKQDWWPGDSVFEIMVGAILTQNTAWTNVERAITNLKASDTLSIDAIIAASHDRLGELIRPSGYYNQKARRLKLFCEWLQLRGGIDALHSQETTPLRNDLLSINGIGPETADDILLFALGRPVFVIDAYTRRIFSRIDLIDGQEKYEDLRTGFENSLGNNAELFNEYHALIVTHAKDICRKQPVCERCCLSVYCRFQRESNRIET